MLFVNDVFCLRSFAWLNSLFGLSIAPRTPLKARKLSITMTSSLTVLLNIIVWPTLTCLTISVSILTLLS